ncbi:hypothetical protein AB0L65_39050 [Nonomuraea sp. NPDC052116]|uniref:hypothetical protein n=1 Tax=Nonomuraea sp. NPDC052116 TaxID=3155665 RepID=UPI003441F12E
MTQTLPSRTGTRGELRERVSTRPAQALVRPAARGAIGSMAPPRGLTGTCRKAP